MFIYLLADTATFDTLKDLLVEATCLAVVGSHENIVSLKAISIGSKPLIAMEICERGKICLIVTISVIILASL